MIRYFVIHTKDSETFVSYPDNLPENKDILESQISSDACEAGLVDIKSDITEIEEIERLEFLVRTEFGFCPDVHKPKLEKIIEILTKAISRNENKSVYTAKILINEYLTQI